MAHVLIAYAREDRSRVERFVWRLEAAGLDVWWDQGLPKGEDWRANIEAALDAAGAVVVVWTKHSVGPNGGFVRDEAARAKSRGILVQVLFDAADPPLGFGELQATDLRRWRGARDNPAFESLVEDCRARLSLPPLPHPRRFWRWIRRAATSSAVAATVAAVWAVTTNVNSFQDRICRAPIGQPGLSDTCGAAGLGGRPTKGERVAWDRLRPGNCEDLRQLVDRFPEGALTAKAAALLSARRLVRGTDWASAPQPLRGYLREGEAASSSEANAKADAVERAHSDAVSLCAPAALYERLAGADVSILAYDCRRVGSGFVCGADYSAVCRLDVRPLTERCG